ncbi:MAG: hypothetical protein SNF33_07490 [Candidatus Algichlamydia australiensis]|nr:hypothetical protein [Chlamydiales bacterium]
MIEKINIKSGPLPSIPLPSCKKKFTEVFFSPIRQFNNLSLRGKVVLIAALCGTAFLVKKIGSTLHKRKIDSALQKMNSTISSSDNKRVREWLEIPKNLSEAQRLARALKNTKRDNRLRIKNLKIQTFPPLSAYNLREIEGFAYSENSLPEELPPIDLKEVLDAMPNLEIIAFNLKKYIEPTLNDFKKLKRVTLVDTLHIEGTSTNQFPNISTLIIHRYTQKTFDYVCRAFPNLEYLRIEPHNKHEETRFKQASLDALPKGIETLYLGEYNYIDNTTPTKLPKRLKNLILTSRPNGIDCTFPNWVFNIESLECLDLICWSFSLKSTLIPNLEGLKKLPNLTRFNVAKSFFAYCGIQKEEFIKKYLPDGCKITHEFDFAAPPLK